ncbi:transcription-repair coupling factor [Arthrobacter sp. KFRI-F3372]|uniref:Transcription-repair-coupling factor n=1 Tax=Pseudarthrobacter oxydans TaxID=1671 RepID=A0AAW8N6I9_PSEOX|nr:transcription-repair coupling factor [Pseudarthrobacter oxydans]MDV2977631.1 transcription-repair coupling factor [Actinomycetes bacterium ARC8]WHP60597.1 transcription-repair coupling factor [Arthrobacter sp. KFRI-F3372]MDR6791513.1 transcription-repair coupling factor (superfamily II helicase) [Pseudarthrobacter oxydans]MDR7162837.1 transcription-repair coupling factor (superfamily II helicase) [Pseudarthrobacter oxydans]BFE42325.1 transcription-repair coupling factor [Pseudarthrobacter o
MSLPGPSTHGPSLDGLRRALAADQTFARVRAEAARGFAVRGQDYQISAPAGLRAVLLAEMADGIAAAGNDDGGSGVVLAVTATGREAEDLTAALRAYLPADCVAEFPSWETLPHERLSPRSDTVGRRLSVLRRLAHPETSAAGPLRIVVAPVRAVVQPVVAGLGELVPVTLKVGQERPFTEVVRSLSDAAYARVDMVTHRGEFAVRGGIIDVFPPTEDHPIRVEFFGDEVDQMRWFAVADQRSLSSPGLHHPTELHAPPCREILITPSVMSRAATLKAQLPAAADMLEKIAGGIAVEGMESLAPVLVDAMVPFVEQLPAGSISVVIEPEKVRTRAHDLAATNEEFLEAAWSTASDGGTAPLDLSSQASAALHSASFRSLTETRSSSLDHGVSWWSITSLAQDEELLPDIDVLNLHAREPRGYQGDVAEMMEFIGSHVRDQWRIVVATEGPGPAQRLAELFHENDIPCARVDSLDHEPQAGIIEVTTAAVGRGFVLDGLKLGLLTEADLLGRTSAGSTKDMRRMPSKRRNAVDPLQLVAGDHVVHEQHGIGKFVELIQRKITVGGSKDTAGVREYLVLEYAPSKRGAPGDRLFVPTDQLDQVTRYVGGDTPVLSKMGGADWASTKSKARKAVKEIAGELIRLYSARMASRGHAFGPDTPWQRELEEAFPYVETPDQLTTINEVKADMEREIPMDRLVSGDVGYGKTEIAVRAAFKAVQDGKQVAVLVPTTLLAQQHYETFTERFSGFPLRVKPLSRFQASKEAKETAEGVKNGTVDVVIGTHRLLSKDFEFKDLGLVIVDEEQRFGVEHKEALKKMRTNVDVLAMSATPIPRTLEMSLTGIRETSTLATPPEERHPVLTYVGPYTDKQTSAAIRRELMREGQVFFVHNRVSTIERTAAKIRELVPEARVEVAHGKMSESRLEQIIVDFWEKRFDVLVCTTIIETGLDISNANTLIVDGADKYGLSQLHQLRGRVGRGRERAYAYFLYPSEKPLGEVALERLKAVATHNELGAGMQLAMKDLEIRGAGNLLGGEQSGHIQGVGFDLYIRLVGEAVADFRGEAEEKAAEMKIELPVNAHLPHDYVPGERLRLEAYRKLAAALTNEAIDEVLAELVDRYGEPPLPAQNLVSVARFRVGAREAGLSDVALQGNFIKFSPATLPESKVMRLNRMYPGSQSKPALDAVLVPKPKTARIGGRDLQDAEILDWANGVIRNIFSDAPLTAPAVSG